MHETEIVLKPYTRAFLDAVEARGPVPLDALPVATLRGLMNEGMRQLGGPGEPVGRVENLSAPGPHGPIPLRAYVPAGDGPFGVVAFYHGGGFVIGGLDEYEAAARRLVNAANAVVVAVDYRLAPEHRFPVALDDAYAALEWIAANARTFGSDAERLAVTGDSAGGYLAAAVAQIARDRGGPRIAIQALVYPRTDPREVYASYDRFGTGLYLTKELMAWFEGAWWASEADKNAPYAAPLREPLDGLPPAIVVLAECDPLVDEGTAYAHALEAAGVPTTLKIYPGVIHAFYSVPTVFPEAAEASKVIGAAIRDAFER